MKTKYAKVKAELYTGSIYYAKSKTITVKLSTLENEETIETGKHFDYAFKKEYKKDYIACTAEEFNEAFELVKAKINSIKL